MNSKSLQQAYQNIPSTCDVGQHQSLPLPPGQHVWLSMQNVLWSEQPLYSH